MPSFLASKSSPNISTTGPTDVDPDIVILFEFELSYEPHPTANDPINIVPIKSVATLLFNILNSSN